MTVKECFDIKGHPTTWGLTEYRNTRAASNATAVERFVRAARGQLDPKDGSYYAQMVRANTQPHKDWLAASNRRHQMRLAWAAGSRCELCADICGDTFRPSNDDYRSCR